MKALKNRWLLLLLGMIVGAYIGGDLALRYANFKYDETLEDYYIDARLLTLIASYSTLEKAENENINGITSDHEVILRGTFLSLVELHKTSHYTKKDKDIRKHLKKAKAYMAERPEQFLNQTFHVQTSSTELASQEATDQARKQLQDAFDYVDSLPPSYDHNDSELSSGSNN
ncbi:hypothetical protein [Ruficoccus sp. ZRK36]|uniref:hypothetical protein n=1 Tax=Ruficoccus sp. ZRK36 TaxID=2866311 RepID=UPI001C73D808|nr:hypothetical protein [Ruficoccus sp. ZRK36]QYY34477.1 hypothetical protein K0V07_09160 [Ruficoccus sp. ZRK36]